MRIMALICCKMGGALPIRFSGMVRVRMRDLGPESWEVRELALETAAFVFVVERLCGPVLPSAGTSKVG